MDGALGATTVSTAALLAVLLAGVETITLKVDPLSFTVADAMVYVGDVAPSMLAAFFCH